VFFANDDYRAYLDLLREHTRAEGVDIWAWCLMQLFFCSDGHL
jgi:REP element-mobilizing transposase RayT